MRYSFVADHFQYLASISLIAAAAAALTALFQKIRDSQQYFGTAVKVAILVLLGILTLNQGRIYANVEILYNDTIAKNPQCWMAHNNLGVALARQGKLSEAIGHFEEALRLNPDFDQARNNLHVALQEAARSDRASAPSQRRTK